MEPKDCSAAQREFVFAKSARDQCRVEKLLKLERPVAERFYALYREQFNPDLTIPDSVVEEWISVGTFGAKEKSPQSRNRASIGRLPKEPDAD
jgi:hypothetical protein